MKTPLLALGLLAVLLLTSCTGSVHLDSTSWFASTAVATIVATGLTSLFNWLMKDKEYQNDYYKKVIDKRIKAIEALEIFVELFAIYCDTDDKENFHDFFRKENANELFNEAALGISKYSIWINPDMRECIIGFSTLVTEVLGNIENKEVEEIEKIAAANYSKIDEYTDELTEYIRRDMLSLHKVEKFIKYANTSDSQETVAHRLGKWLGFRRHT